MASHVRTSTSAALVGPVPGPPPATRYRQASGSAEPFGDGGVVDTATERVEHQQRLPRHHQATVLGEADIEHPRLPMHLTPHKVGNPQQPRRRVRIEVRRMKDTSPKTLSSSASAVSRSTNTSGPAPISPSVGCRVNTKCALSTVGGEVAVSTTVRSPTNPGCSGTTTQ